MSTTRPFTHAGFALLLFLASASWLQAEAAVPAEKAKIEALITHIENLKGATFIRPISARYMHEKEIRAYETRSKT